ncbi:MAG: hypothetical protein K2X77_19820 [Candidatus Obscuribacterales bacterium]|nr:hypothetical protein [Candidatus Obscuribacterales bacterium]
MEPSEKHRGNPSLELVEFRPELHNEMVRLLRECGDMMIVAVFDNNMSTGELMRVAADHHHKRIELSNAEKKALIDLLKLRGQEELEYGQEMEVDSVRLLRRVTGAVGVYFS